MLGFDLRAHTHLLVVAGSRAHGLQRPGSDVDVKGAAIPPLPWHLGFVHRFEQADDPEQLTAFVDVLTAGEQAVVATTKLEGSVYDLRKVARLASDANPHMLELLFCRDQEVRLTTPLGERLREAAPAFLSRRARHSFGGYANAQLKRIRTHRRWLLEPPTTAPARADFGLPQTTLLPRDQLAAAEAAIRKQLDRWELDLSMLPPSEATHLLERLSHHLAEQQIGADERFRAAGRTVGLDDNVIDLLDRERRYKAAMAHHQQFRRWQTHRNPERAALEARHGYDTKHASHLVRLMRMADEIVRTGEVHVWRGDRDADELLAIRDGAWSYDELEAFAEASDRSLTEALATSPLPARVDWEALDALVVDLVRSAVVYRGS